MIEILVHFSLAVLIVACMGGCLGCYGKPKLVSSVNEPLKGKKYKTQSSQKHKKLEDFWASSIYDMDNNSEIQSNITSTSSQMHDSHGASSSNNPSDFVNHGLLQWNQTREQWVQNKKPKAKTKQLREPCINNMCLSFAKKFWLCSWNATYDSLLCSNKPFRKPIPLPEMIDFLVDIWEQEGMYD